MIRFTSNREPGKNAKKTTTSCRIVDGKKIVTKKYVWCGRFGAVTFSHFRTEDNGEETVEVLEEGVVKSKTVNGAPVAVTV